MAGFPKRIIARMYDDQNDRERLDAIPEGALMTQLLDDSEIPESVDVGIYELVQEARIEVSFNLVPLSQGKAPTEEEP
jgi:hypothetical protein